MNNTLNHKEAYVDYCWVDFAPEGVKSRNNIIDCRSIQLPDNPIDVYCSVCRFGEDFKEHVWRTGSVTNCDSFTAYSDSLYLDIDNESLNKALESTKMHLTRLTDHYGITLGAIQVYFSGQKGFHILIPAELIGWGPSSSLHKIMKIMVTEIAGGTPFDTAVYDKVRLLRMPGSIHSGKGMYKVRLDPTELIGGLTIDEIKRRAMANEQWRPSTKVELSVSPKLHEVYQRAVQTIECPVSKTRPKSNAVPPCIERLLAGCVEGERSEAAIRIASFFRIHKQQAKEQTRKTLGEWNAKCTPPLEDVELDRVLDSAYAGEYNYGCTDKFLRSHCNSKKCKHGMREKSESDSFERITTAKLPDGTLIEMVYDEIHSSKTRLLVWKNGKIDYTEEFTVPLSGRTFAPLDAEAVNTKKGIPFADRAEDYDSVDSLFKEIYDLVRKYVALPDQLIEIGTLYALFTWLYESFRTVPYLHIKGAHSTGKSRLLSVLAYVCYKSIWSSSASSTAWIFRTIDKQGGTLILDEADYKDSSNSSDIVKMLNLGYEAGGTVDRCSVKGDDFCTVSFSVFGPKICAGRLGWDEPAAESRCISIEMDPTIDTTGYPVNLPVDLADEVRVLQRRLLMFRLKHRNMTILEYDVTEFTKEPRLAQIVQPLYAIARLLDPESGVLIRLDEFVRQQDAAMAELRKDSIEGTVLQSIFNQWSQQKSGPILLKNITDEVNGAIGNKGYACISDRKIGSIVRNSLGIETVRTNRGYVIYQSPANETRLAHLSKRYRIPFGKQVTKADASLPSPTTSSETSDVTKGF